MAYGNIPKYISNPQKNKGPFGTQASKPVIGKRDLGLDAASDAGFERHQRPTSNNSGAIFYTSKGVGEDGNPDTFEYTRTANAIVQNASKGIIDSAINPTFRTGVAYTKTGRRAEGRNFAGRKGPEQAKRTKYVGSDGVSGGGGSNKQAKGTRSTILTGSRGLGNSSAAKTLLGG